MGKRFQVEVAGIHGVLEAEHPPLSSLKLFQNGEPVQKGSKRNTFALQMADGSIVEATMKSGLPAELHVGAAKYELGPPTPVWLMIVAFLPMALGILGGCIGWVAGLGAATLNFSVARSDLPMPLKIAIMLGVGGVALLGTLFIAGLIQLAIGLPAPPP